MYKDLYNFGPPGNNNSFYPEMNNYFTSGQVAMAMNYFAFFPALANKGTNPLVDKTGFFVNPAGPYGDQFASLGGQGLNVSAHCPKDRQQASLAFLEWFAQDSVQAKWAQLGGYSCNIKALESPDFAKIAPYNPAFAQTMTMVKDFWNIPEYGDLLAIAQKYLSAFIVGNQGTAKEAMDNIAKEQQQVLVDAGYIKK
jgi:multiple sugar transport system substrate-binding protein